MLVGAILSNGCQGAVPDTSVPRSLVREASASGAEPPGVAHDEWQRSKECAEQTERILKRMHLELGQTSGNEDSVGETENHYSAKYRRCFVRTRFITSLKVLRGLTPEAKKSMPTSYWKLFDAFEGRELATCTYDHVESGCMVGGRLGGCVECRQFTKDRMEE